MKAIDTREGELISFYSSFFLVAALSVYESVRIVIR